MEYSLPKEHRRFISSLNAACRFISEAGSPSGSLPRCDKSLGRCLLGKLSETLKTALLFTGAGGTQRERERVREREREERGERERERRDSDRE